MWSYEFSLSSLRLNVKERDSERKGGMRAICERKESEAVRERERGEWSTREKESRVRERRVRKSSFSLHKVPFLVISPKFNISKMVKKSHFQKVGQNLGHSFNETFLNQLIYLYIIFNLVTFVGYILCLVDFCSHVSYTHRNLNALIFLR